MFENNPKNEDLFMSNEYFELSNDLLHFRQEGGRDYYNFLRRKPIKESYPQTKFLEKIGGIISKYYSTLNIEESKKEEEFVQPVKAI